MERGAELQLEIAELDMENSEIRGSLLIKADSPLGKCTLKNVSILNSGIDKEASNIFWKNEIKRKEACTIVIHGNGEFYAEDIKLEGPHYFEVENGMRATLQHNESECILVKEPISHPTWEWNYTLTPNYEIALQKRKFL